MEYCFIGNFLQLLQYNIYEYIGILRKSIPLFAASDIKSVYCMQHDIAKEHFFTTEITHGRRDVTILVISVLPPPIVNLYQNRIKWACRFYFNALFINLYLCSNICHDKMLKHQYATCPLPAWRTTNPAGSFYQILRSLTHIRRAEIIFVTTATVNII